MAITLASAALITALLGLVGTGVDSVIGLSEADKTRQFNREERQSAEAFNASEAQKNRDWQEYMTSSAHQREVADLRAAGLNPVLSANSGAGAGTGATAVSPFGGSSAQAAGTNFGKSSQLAGQNYTNALATDFELKMKSEPRFEDKVQKTFRNGKLVREVVTKGSNGLQ